MKLGRAFSPKAIWYHQIFREIKSSESLAPPTQGRRGQQTLSGQGLANSSFRTGRDASLASGQAVGEFEHDVADGFETLGRELVEGVVFRVPK